MIDQLFQPAPHSLRHSCMYVSSALCLALLVGAAPVPAQRSLSGEGSPIHNQMTTDPLDQQQPFPMGPNDPIAQEKRLKALNAERQKSMVADTNKLVKLAAELNAEINGKHPGELTLSQLRQVAEIEKLAHNIKEKMCTSVRPAPMMAPPPPLMTPPGIPPPM